MRIQPLPTVQGVRICTASGQAFCRFHNRVEERAFGQWAAGHLHHVPADEQARAGYP
jgi:hypothetical protein